jgi:pSer/pThr/pTyr-binding forkhead associated (FHA) protein
MDHGLLDVLRYFLLALFWLFLVYAARMVYVEVRRGQLERAALGAVEEIGGVEHRRPQRPAKLRVIESPDHEGERFELDRETTIGRGSQCTISLPHDEFVSTVHARIYPEDGALFLEDLGSTNGTFLNAERIDRPQRLRRGDRLTIGNALFEVSR